jgi:hypothetical protein
MKIKAVLFAVACVAFVACSKSPAPAAEEAEAAPEAVVEAAPDAMADALSAGWPGMAENATVVDWEGNVLKEGSNGYTCLPTPPMLAGDAPMCMDSEWMKWAGAWQNKTDYAAESLGISYMLNGDEGASNTDPYAEGPTDDNEWIVEGAHLMIVAPAELLNGFPTDPYNGGPYVMWKGTPYAHLMVPIGARDGAAEAAAPEATSDALADALSAGWPGMAENATVVDWEGNVLKEGSNGYTCLPTPPMLAGNAPMCMDSEWMKWAGAWQNKTDYAAESLGISYMLNGDEGASNTDPYAEGPTDDNEWIVEGAHLMIVAPAELLNAFPTDPDNGGPYVMWKGTPYAHLMVPVGARP